MSGVVNREPTQFVRRRPAEVVASVKPMRQIVRCVAMVIAFVPCVAHAQAPTPVRPAYTPERYDEDWSFLRDASKRTDLFDPIKWIPLRDGGAWFVSLGGELRERVQAVDNPAFGLPAPTRNADVFHRTFLFADIHLGPHVRTFVEVVHAETRGSTTKPSTFEQDQLDLLQTFADVIVPVGK